MGQRCNLCWAIVVILHWANGNLLIGPSSHQHVGSMLGQCGRFVGPTLGHCRQLTLGQPHNFFVGPSSYKHVGTLVDQCQNMLGYCWHSTLGQQYNFFVGPSSHNHVGTLVGQCQNMLGYSEFKLAQCKNSFGASWTAVGIQHCVNEDFFVGS